LCLTDRVVVHDHYRQQPIRSLGDTFESDPAYREYFEAMAVDIMRVFKGSILLGDCKRMALPELKRWHERAGEIHAQEQEQWRR
jgi:hypothetical protein